MKKLQNSFNDFLPLTYRDFRLGINDLTSNKAVVAELLRICCEEDEVKAIQMAFERILGKPEKVLVIKRTLTRTLFPDARTKALKPVVDDSVQDAFVAPTEIETRVVISEANAPGILLSSMVEKIGDKPRSYAYDVLDNKDKHTVAEVMACNLYGIAMSGSNLAAIRLLFEYIDGSVADVIRLDGEDTVLLENWADVAPYEAQQDETGVWYIQSEAVA